MMPHLVPEGRVNGRPVMGRVETYERLLQSFACNIKPAQAGAPRSIEEVSAKFKPEARRDTRQPPQRHRLELLAVEFGHGRSERFEYPAQFTPAEIQLQAATII